MVERANGIIKSSTILKEKYVNKTETEIHLLQFLVYYILYRRHGSLKRELRVKTPYEAIAKWFELKSEIFKEKIFCSLKQKLLFLQHQINPKQGCFTQQPGEPI